MNRREFIKMGMLGSMTLFLSGCGMSALAEDTSKTQDIPKGSISGGNYYYGMSAQLKIVIDRFYSRTGQLHGKKSLLIATAYNSADWTMDAISNHYDTLVRYMEWQDVGKVLGVGCGSRQLVERSEFGDMAFKIGENL